MISYIEIIGYIAAVLTTVAFVPQVVLVHKTRNTTSISISMFLIFSLGVICWGIYGIILHQLPIILANGLTLLLSLYILYMKMTEKRRNKNSIK